MSSDSDSGKPATKHQKLIYKLMHRRFGHFGLNVLRHLYQVAQLKEKIRIPTKGDICEPCQLENMKNKTNKKLSPRKTDILELISIDIAGSFPSSLRGNTVMMEIVNNVSRKNWSIPMKSKDEAIAQLHKVKLREELQTGKKIKRTRTDNAPELIKLLQEWEQSSGVVPEYTIVATSNQNGIAERSIQTSEKTMRARIKDACLPIEFWDEAAETSAYSRNHIPIGPIIDGKRTSPEQVYTGEKPRVDRIRVWGSKCYSFVNPKTLSAKGCHDKLVDRG
jgi:hypothetical protein